MRPCFESGKFGDVYVSSVAIGRNLPNRDCRGLSCDFGFTQIDIHALRRSAIHTLTPHTPTILRTTRHGSSRSDSRYLNKLLKFLEPHVKGDTAANRNNGRRPYQIPPLEQRLCPPQSAPSQPGHISHRARVNLDIMAQSEGGAKTGRKVDHIGQEEHRSQQALSHVHIIRMLHTVARKGNI